MHAAIWWIRRDLRLEDNRALAAALESAELVIPLFILDPYLLDKPHASPIRTSYLIGGLRALDASLRERGSRLLVRRGPPQQVLAALAAEIKPRCEKLALFFEEGYSPYARERDERILSKSGLDGHPTAGLTYLHPLETVKADGAPYTTYSPFRRTWLARAESHQGLPLPAPSHIPGLADIAGDPLPNPKVTSCDFPPGESEAHRRLDHFISGVTQLIFGYDTERDRIDLDHTSRLSPYIRFGMLSAHQAVYAARIALEYARSEKERRATQTWLDELIWREFYQALLFHHPAVLEGSLRPAYRRLAWRNDSQDFAAWCEGRSGYPIVDAAMRQLSACGWIHNRARMIVASFLVKDLLVDWRWGEEWFMRHLIDGDPAANNGGWQWCAGTSSDAAPYFRIFNPITQSRKFDPHGLFIRRWVDELRNVPDAYIHEPWKMPAEVQRSNTCRIGQDYPAPIVEHDRARRRCLAAYRLALAARQ